MKTKNILLAVLCGALALTSAHATERVTPDNFNRAETDYNFRNKVNAGMFGKFGHDRMPASVDKQIVVRMNRDTLYSWGV